MIIKNKTINYINTFLVKNKTIILFLEKIFFTHKRTNYQWKSLCEKYILNLYKIKAKNEVRGTKLPVNEGAMIETLDSET